MTPEPGSSTAATVQPETQFSLAEISRRVSPGARAVLLLDRAGWHASPRPRVPGDIGLIPLPPHAPELASMEDAWE